jgi:hypothetical protein
MKSKITKTRTVALAAVSLLALATNGAFASNAGVFDVNAKKYYGKTYGDWVVAYWQWALSIPFATNPWANDSDGSFSANGQSGPVWFLGGTLGNSVTRSVTIPASNAIFLPVSQWIFGATVGDCQPSNPGVSCDVPTLKRSAAAAAKAATLLERN